jgi:23S rRNA pseudouridine2605 synthase
MPRDESRPPRHDSPKRDFKSGGYGKKPWERRERPQGGDERGEGGGYRKPFGQRPAFGGPRGGFGGGDRGPQRRPFDDELFTASGKVAEVVGTSPQSRYDILRKLWDFFREEQLVVTAGRKTPANADNWRNEGDERPPREERPYRDRPPQGDRPYRPRDSEGGERPPYRPRSAEGGGDRPPYRPREGGDRPPYRPREGGGDRPYRPREGGGDRPDRPAFPRRAGGSRPPYRSTRTPAGNHPTARKAQTLEGVPRRKFKETREDK